MRYSTQQDVLDFVEDNTLPLAFVVVVEHGGSGSDVAGSVAAQLLEQAQS